MTQHTGRDAVWDTAMRVAVTEEYFHIDDVAENGSVDVSKRTVRDTMRTMADLGWLKKQKPKGSRWKQGPLLVDEDDVMSPIEDDQSDGTVRQEEGIKRVEEFSSVAELKSGEVYFGTVEKKSHSYPRNALIHLANGHINLGPIDKSAVGQEVKFRNLSGIWGKCLDEEYTYEGYDPSTDGSSSSNSSESDGTITDSDPENKNKLLKGHL